MANQLFKDREHFSSLKIPAYRLLWTCCQHSTGFFSVLLLFQFVFLLAHIKSKVILFTCSGQDSKLWHYCYSLSSFSADRQTFPTFSQKQSWRSASFIDFQGKKKKNQNLLFTEVIQEKSHKSKQVVTLCPALQCCIHPLWMIQRHTWVVCMWGSPDCTHLKNKAWILPCN